MTRGLDLVACSLDLRERIEAQYARAATFDCAVEFASEFRCFAQDDPLVGAKGGSSLSVSATYSTGPSWLLSAISPLCQNPLMERRLSESLDPGGFGGKGEKFCSITAVRR